LAADGACSVKLHLWHAHDGQMIVLEEAGKAEMPMIRRARYAHHSKAPFAHGVASVPVS
jgi:hypothetical protein